jgi:hypothetical protein
MGEAQLKSFLKKVKLNEKFVSQSLGLVVLVVIGVLIFNYFSGFEEKEAPSEALTEEAAQEVVVNLT